jgi:hypothetical protein
MARPTLDHASKHVLPLFDLWHIVNFRQGIVEVNRSRGGTGIRVRLRSVSRKGWEFESPRDHTTRTSSLLDISDHEQDACASCAGDSNGGAMFCEHAKRASRCPGRTSG